MPQDLAQYPRPQIDLRTKLQRYKALRLLASMKSGEVEYIGTIEGEHPAVLQNRMRARLGVDRLTSMFKWSVRQKQHGVTIRKVGKW